MNKDENEIQTTENNFNQESKDEEVAKMRKKLLQLSEDGEIKYSTSSLKKASNKIILKIYAEYERQQAEKTNAFLTDLLISKFSDLLGGLEAIESSETLEKELSKDELLKKDVQNLIEKIAPFIPFIGLLSGGITVGKHVVNKKYKNEEETEVMMSSQ